jgi:hypothetical protein
MPEKFMGMSKKSKRMPCIRHRPRASSTSFSGNWRAKFREFKNLSETTADEMDNADEETPGSTPVSGVGEVSRLHWIYAAR